MADGYSDTESASSLSQSEAEQVRHRDSYDFRVLTRLSGKGVVLYVSNVLGIGDLKELTGTNNSLCGRRNPMGS